MKILVIVDMQDELQAFLKKQSYTHQFIHGFDYFYNEINDKKIYLVKTEVGKVNAAIITTFFIEKIKPNIVINAGICGSLHENIPIYTTIFSTKLAYFDVDLTAFGLPFGQLDNMNLYFKASKSLVRPDKNDVCGLIVSSDTFVHKKEQKELILKNFPKALACDMEGASIAQVATFFKRKFLVLRTVSDVIAIDDSSKKYLNQKFEAIDICATKTLELIHSL